MSFALVRVRVRREGRPGGQGHLGLEEFAAVVGLHPDHVRRLVVLGLLDADADPSGRLHFAPAQVGRAARIERLRAGFCLNYAGIGVVLDLLDRIAELEAAERAAGVRLPRRSPQPSTFVDPVDTVDPVGTVGTVGAGRRTVTKSGGRGQSSVARRYGGSLWTRTG
ncbi:chaperone modulator CbpM [Actinopolymorpha singaporensis]|uniref:MerR HTH family regulatory protein n=1 Tax=Actinopolymorpha singaporensis TaxID=117157 RepID=A0A1H1YMD0_9ACTN|nr:chaperone modulator CbpM [Actinopolymorpha singaporensis]SDT22256.1 MerR HTH family regulatory protein [Actinopolymorpha singaporensis]